MAEKRKMNIGKYFKNVFAEMKKVIWPTPKQAVKNTMVVIAAVILVGAFIAGVDIVFTQISNIVFK